MYATTTQQPSRYLPLHSPRRKERIGSARERRTRALAWFFTRVMAVRLAQAVQKMTAVAL